jgi:HK97 family phage portal protein
MPDLEIIRPRRETWLRRTLRSLTLGPFNPKDRTIARYFGGSASSTGISVNEESSLTFSAVWNAVVLISGDVAKVPLPLYRRLPNGGKDKYSDHGLYELVHDYPNPEMSSFQFRRTLQGHVLVWGNAYAEIERDAMDRPVALWPLLPWAVSSYRDRAGDLWYRVQNPGGADVNLPARNVLHLSGFGLSGICGEPPIRKAMESIGLGLAAEKFGATFFGNGSTFGGIISYPTGTAKDPQVRKENREAIESRHQGVERAHRFLALYEGAAFTAIGVDPDKAQFLETRRFQIEEVARWFNIPVHKLKELARSTNNNIEHQGIEYATDTLQPWFRMWEGELGLKLIRRLERKQQFFEHVTEALTRGDSAAQGELISKQFAVGAASPNEIRGKFNQNPVTGGDQVWVPSNMMPLDLALKYWEASINETNAKAEAAKRPPPAPVVAPPKTDGATEDEKKAWEIAVLEARQRAQQAEDAADLAQARLDEFVAARAVDTDAFAAEAERLRQARDWFAADAHDARIALAEMEARIASLTADGVATRADNERLMAAYSRIDQEQRAEAEARVRAEQDRDAAVSLVAQAEQERDIAVAAIGELSTKQAELVAQRAELAAAIGVVEARATALTAERAALTAESETLRTDLSRARADLATELEKAQTWRGVMLAAMRSLFAEATERLLAKESNAARKQQATPEKLRAWIERFYPLHVETARDVFRPLVGPWTAITGEAPNLLLDRLVSEHVATSRDALLRACEALDGDEMAATLERTLLRWEAERADAMADALLREGMGERGR